LKHAELELVKGGLQEHHVVARFRISKKKGKKKKAERGKIREAKKA